MDELNGSIGAEATNLSAVQLTLSVWAGLMTLAIAAVGVLVFRRVRKSRHASKQWSSNASVLSDEETGSTGSMSATSSVVDLSSVGSTGGAHNRGFDGGVEVDLDSNASSSQPDLNAQEEPDFGAVHGLYEENGKVQDSTHQSVPKAALSSVVPNYVHGSVSKRSHSLYFPDQGNSYM